MRKWSDWNAGYYWQIQNMYLTQNQPGRGLMSILLYSVKTEMANQNGRELRLHENKNNKVAFIAYKKDQFYTF